MRCSSLLLCHGALFLGSHTHTTGERVHNPLPRRVFPVTSHGNWRTAIRSRIALLQTYDTNNMVSHYEWKQKPYNLLCYKYHVVYSVECTVPKCTINRAQLTFEVKSVSAYQRQTATVSVNVCGLCVCVRVTVCSVAFTRIHSRYQSHCRR